MGRQGFETYRRFKVAEIERASGGYRLPGAPFALLHPRRTDYAVLLVHGLNESPYYMADVAAILHQQGFNAVTVLLPGHGTRPEDMADVTAEAWRSEVETGLAIASLVGRKVTVAGFSMGGALAVDAALGRNDIEGLFLFAPALELRAQPLGAFAGLTCLPGARAVTVEMQIVRNPVKYKERTANGVCQTYRVMQQNADEGNNGYSANVPMLEKIRRLGTRIKIPTFVAMTYGDARISPESITAFAAAVEAPAVLATYGNPGSSAAPAMENGGRVVQLADEPVPHAYILRRTNEYNGQANPHFDALQQALTEFVDENF